MNGFKYFIREIGYRFDKINRNGLVILIVKLTETHLESSSETYTLDELNIYDYFLIKELLLMNLNSYYFVFRYIHRIFKANKNNLIYSSNNHKKG